jgi:hypothetical protein
MLLHKGASTKTRNRAQKEKDSFGTLKRKICENILLWHFVFINVENSL